MKRGRASFSEILSLILIFALAGQISPAQKPKFDPNLPYGEAAVGGQPVPPANARGPHSAPPRKDIPAIAKAANRAIVTIVTAVNDKPIALGTGFIVGADGVIVTNYHVIKTGNVAVVKFADGTVFQSTVYWHPTESAISPSSKYTGRSSKHSHSGILIKSKSGRKWLQ